MDLRACLYRACAWVSAPAFVPPRHAIVAPCQRKPLCLAKNRDCEDHRPGRAISDLPERCPTPSSRRPRRRLGETPPAVFPRPGRRMLFTIGTFGQRGPLLLTRGGPCPCGPYVQARARPGPACDSGPACDPGPMCGPSRRATWWGLAAKGRGGPPPSVPLALPVLARFLSPGADPLCAVGPSDRFPVSGLTCPGTP